VNKIGREPSERMVRPPLPDNGDRPPRTSGSLERRYGIRQPSGADDDGEQ
jgi:hypothetical protein